MFDKRATSIKPRFNSTQLSSDDIISKCHQCNGVPTDKYINCMNSACNVLLLQCDECAIKYNQCCSNECRLAYEHQLHTTEQRYTSKKPFRYRVGTTDQTHIDNNESKQVTNGIDSSLDAQAHELTCTTITCPHHDIYCQSISTSPIAATLNTLNLIKQYTNKYYPAQAHMLCGDTIGNLLVTFMSLNQSRHILFEY